MNKGMKSLRLARNPHGRGKKETVPYAKAANLQLLGDVGRIWGPRLCVSFDEKRKMRVERSKRILEDYAKKKKLNQDICQFFYLLEMDFLHFVTCKLFFFTSAV